jgi:hypothetical protein
MSEINNDGEILYRQKIETAKPTGLISVKNQQDDNKKQL